jgi:hypothetical protein
MKLHAHLLKAFVLVTLLTAPIAHAQTDTVSKPDTASQLKQAAQFFQLEFVVREREGDKVINHRSYFMQVAASDIMSTKIMPSSMRNGTKVPVNTDGKNFQYIDVGLNIDCRNIQQINNNLSLNVAIEQSSILDTPNEIKGEPLILQNKWDSTVVVPLGKKTVIFSSDEVTSTRVMEVELTVTPIQH